GAPGGPGRATGESLYLQGGRLTPQAPALRTSHSQACHHHTAQRYRRSAPIQPTTTEPLSAGLRTPRPLRRNPTQPLDTDSKEDSFWPSRGYEPSAVLTAHHVFYCGEAVAGKLFPHQQFTVPQAFLMCGHLALRDPVFPFTVSRTESLPCQRSWRPGWPRLGLSPGA